MNRQVDSCVCGGGGQDAGSSPRSIHAFGISRTRGVNTVDRYTVDVKKTMMKIKDHYQSKIELLRKYHQALA